MCSCQLHQPFVCSVCGESHPPEDRREFEGQDLCARCLEEETVICHECGARIWRDDDAGTDEIHLCQRCYESYYFNCTRCGALFHMDDAHYSDDDPGEEEPLCRACHERLERGRTIQNYYFKPEPIFYGDGPRYFGVELEVDSGGESNANAEELLQIVNSGEERAYCKHDGSLEDGFEIVTHPMTLDYHRETMPWETLLHKAAELGYLSHKAYTCGLHIHVNRDAFGETEAQQDASIALILYFFEKHWDELLKPLAWTTFVSGIQEPELIQYLKERRLYVNEPVEEEEDD